MLYLAEDWTDIIGEVANPRYVSDLCDRGHPICLGVTSVNSPRRSSSLHRFKATVSFVSVARIFRSARINLGSLNSIKSVTKNNKMQKHCRGRQGGSGWELVWEIKTKVAEVGVSVYKTHVFPRIPKQSRGEATKGEDPHSWADSIDAQLGCPR